MVRQNPRREKPIDRSRVPKRPNKPDVAEAAAYLRLLGASQLTASKAVGMDQSHLCQWEKADWWPAIVEAARKRWLVNVTAKTMAGILECIDSPSDKAATVRWSADRIIPEFAPPKQQHEHDVGGNLRDLIEAAAGLVAK